MGARRLLPGALDGGGHWTTTSPGATAAPRRTSRPPRERPGSSEWSTWVALRRPTASRPPTSPRASRSRRSCSTPRPRRPPCGLDPDRRALGVVPDLVRLVERLRVLPLPAWRDEPDPADRRARRDRVPGAHAAGRRVGRPLARHRRPRRGQLRRDDRADRRLDGRRPDARWARLLADPARERGGGRGDRQPLELVRPLMESLEYDLLPRDADEAPRCTASARCPSTGRWSVRWPIGSETRSWPPDEGGARHRDRRVPEDVYDLVAMIPTGSATGSRSTSTSTERARRAA